MPTKKIIKDFALVVCGHGSRNSNYNKDLQKIKIKLEKKINHDVYDCFIEINKPSIEDCISKIINKYKKVFFFPLLLFEGKHMIEDVNNQIYNLSKKFEKEIHLIEKLSLVDDILPHIKTIIGNFNFSECEMLITSCSYSKSKKVISELEEYTEKLSFSLNIKKKLFHFVGNENKVLEQLDRYKVKKIIVHPVFFFNGFLYKKNTEIFSKSFKTLKLLPLSHYDEIIEAISLKLLRNF